ncbi:SusD/RagB family nutrient-binding outer membrane lipoprotein [Catalinimonas niigatensis]|uniref:SusD/RagB family nutrient-binding outer membrane lipoprotein n=1 Tax=Catalinimonas niigatensis TaxID=1397264 RepID=UPI0026650B67|nr:SusD/RagB family nutrient-binding outer membrane lipoprotein [Catalinimonas niigatensis]WPP53270.1 SusD/RagB family nutrient-binding outer membrane lipoprotein [Catalinimonas niigatensis]
MKYLNKWIVCTLATVFLVAGCNTDELQDLNINPQAVNQIDLNYLFTSAELSIASQGASGDNRYTDWRTNIGLASTAIQQLAATGGIAAAGNFYRHNEETSAAPWEFTYNDQLKNIEEVLKQTGEGGYSEGQLINTRNAARILRVFSFARLTDFYGSIPYFEANKGIEGIFFPTYDPQSVIYPDLLKELEEATAAISTSNPDDGFTRADMIYDGDIAKWKKWGYSLMLRLAMRVSNVAPDLANQYVTKAVTGGVFTSNEDNVWIPMDVGPSEWQDQNGISRAFYPGDGGEPAYMSATMIDFLKGPNANSVADDDPRLMILSGGIAKWDAAGWTPINTDPLAQVGLPNGFAQSDIEAQAGGPVILQETYSRINYLMLDDNDPYMIMNYAEVEFLLAEALVRGIGSGITGTAQQHYEDGVRAAMQMYVPFDASLEVSDAEVDAYLAARPYGVVAPPLEMIGEQMWVSKFFNWWDAWSDWRRTGYPELVAYTSDDSPITGGIIPLRLRYPTTEVAANPNFNFADKNNYTSPVWWDGGQE